MVSLAALQKDIRAQANPIKAKLLMRFFKTGPGQYGAGDIFLGIMVPQSRAIVKKYRGTDLKIVEKLLHSKFHEERLIALLLLVDTFEREPKQRKEVYSFYLKNTRSINNWDLVDLSAPRIVGEYLLDKNTNILTKLAKSKNLWERRIAVLATFQFIKNKRFDEPLRIATMLVHDEHDLIHKAVGWMLREIGKRSLTAERKFLDAHYHTMPRTMLRYAIERFPREMKAHYMQ